MKFSAYRLLSRRNDLKALISGRLPQRVVRKFVFRRAFRAASFITRLLKVSR